MHPHTRPVTDDNLVARVGQRIRRLRTDAGVGLREQARALQMSPSSLSELENARGGISLGRLQRVAEHFGLHITDLLAEAGVDDGVPDIEIIRDAASMSGVQRGHGVRYQLLGPSNGHSLQPVVISFEPGGGYEDDQISHVGEDFFYVVSGAVELLLGDEVHALMQGDAVRYRAETPHALRNASAASMALVVGAATAPW